MTPLRRILSVLLALVLALAGHLVLWSGGVRNSVLSVRLANDDPLLLVTILLGALIVGAAVLTVVLSSLGPIVIGIIDLVVSLVMFLAAPVLIPVISAVRAVNSDWSSGLAQSLGMGIAALTGAAFLAAGLAGRKRRRLEPSRVSRLTAVLVAVVGVGAGLPLAFGGGAVIYARTFLLQSTEPQPVPVLSVLAGAALVGAGIYAASLSSGGVLLMGAVVSVLGIVGALAPALVAAPLRDLDRNVATGVQLAAGNGNLAMVGVVILAAGVGLAIRARTAVASV